MATYDINLFFYIKGSKDFPSGHGINEPFGFDQADPSKFNDKESGYIKVNSETAIFDTSIRDIYLKYKGSREIENIYSLYSDQGNMIFNSHVANFPNLGSNPRNDRSLEYISSMIVKPSTNKDSSVAAAENATYRLIYPNYTYTSKANLDALLNIATTSSNKGDYPPRQAIFWQKMFTLLEYLKKNEKEIIESNATRSFPEEYNTNKDEWFSQTINIENVMKNEKSPIGPYIGLFVGSGDYEIKDSKYTLITHPRENSEEIYKTNPIRNMNITGVTTGSGVPSSDVDSDGVPTLSVVQDDLWDKLKIKYVPRSADFEISQHQDRIKFVEFTIKYKQYYDISDDENQWDTWRFKVYFDPDAFVADSASNNFEVWTYNDLDLDEEYPEANEAGFNKYDNDYANLLRNPPKYGHFIATEAEVEQSMAREMLKKMSGKDFTDFLPVDVIRVSPEIIVSGETGDHKPIHVVNWPSIDSNINPNAHGVGKQTFYVFYNGNAPSAAQAREAIKDYLIDLHKDCGEQVLYASNETQSGVKYIGHGQGTELRNWLAKMYPDLFSETVVYIVPPYHTFCEDSDSNQNNKWDPEKYFHTTSQQSIYETMINALGTKFSKFAFNSDGSQEIPVQGARTSFPTEIFYIGGLNDEQNNSAFKFSAPFIATMNADTIDKPLTKQTGFANYVPKFFNHNASPTSPADLLQFVIIKLMNQMFQKGTSKSKLNPIAGVNVTYYQDTDADIIVGEEKTCNVATFTINNVIFNVYAQTGKNFCNINGQEVAV